MTTRHSHSYSGQTFTHSHDAGDPDHGYFEHAEDPKPGTVTTQPVPANGTDDADRCKTCGHMPAPGSANCAEGCTHDCEPVVPAVRRGCPTCDVPMTVETGLWYCAECDAYHGEA